MGQLDCDDGHEESGDDVNEVSGDDACNEIVDQTEHQCSDLLGVEHDQPIALS